MADVRGRLTVLLTMWGVATVATLVYVGSVESEGLLFIAILLGVAVIAFRLGADYRELRESR